MLPTSCGDAAHTFLPTSQQGASQAVEDAVTIAHVLTLAKERGQPIGVALRAYQKLRYDRVIKAQQLGFDNRNMWYGCLPLPSFTVCSRVFLARRHKLDYTKPIDPESIKLPYASWLWMHNAIDHAKENYDSVVQELLNESVPASDTKVEPARVEQLLPTAVAA